MDLAALHVLIKRFEGCKLMPYYCPAGVLTCGWGSTGPDVFPGRAWTQEYADSRMLMDAQKFARGTLALCPSLTGQRLSAVADFSYNLGLGRLKSSTLRKKINASEWDSVPVELRKWVNGGGRKLPGLVFRREAEIGLL
jgi:GH24 family phage-related lysozyme (muramidase)